MRLRSLALASVVLAGAWALVPSAPAAAAPRAAVHQDRGKPTVAVVKAGADLVTVAKVVGVTPAVLQRDLAAGQTLLHIAAGRYASADALATALAAGIKAKLAAAVAAGKMTAAQAVDAYSQAHAAFAKLAVTPHPALSTGTRAKTAIQISMPDVDRVLTTVLATACQTAAAALEAARRAGDQTILAICQRTNPSATADSLVAALTAPLKTKLDALVTAGQLTAAQESAMFAAMRTKLTYLVTSVPPAGGAAT